MTNDTLNPQIAERLGWELVNERRQRRGRGLAIVWLWRDSVGKSKTSAWSSAERASDDLPRWTTSVDVALTLVPDGAYFRLIGYEDGDWRASINFQNEWIYEDTPAIAICKAWLAWSAQDD